MKSRAKQSGMATSHRGGERDEYRDGTRREDALDRLGWRSRSVVIGIGLRPFSHADARARGSIEPRADTMSVDKGRQAQFPTVPSSMDGDGFLPPPLLIVKEETGNVKGRLPRQ